jgi:hypothetical protein
MILALILLVDVLGYAAYHYKTGKEVRGWKLFIPFIWIFN